MSDNKSECDAVVVVGALVVFALPLTLLIPEFTLWDVVPKVRVTRFHLVSQYLTWPQLSSAVACILALFCCIYLEIRKRKLDDMLEKVLTVNQATEMTIEEEKEPQAAAMRECELLDTSSEHYERLVQLRDELRKREKPKKQMPPVIEPSTSNIHIIF